MDSNTSSQVQGFSSPDLMAASLRCEAVLKLGKTIASELELDDRADTLSLWMAYYIAELIQRAETAEPNNRVVDLAKCAEAILEIWKHRSHFPAGKRPLEDFEPILRTLEDLDPDRDMHRYFVSLRRAAAEDEETSEASEWLRKADELDYSARILIRYCLARAAQDATDKNREWVALAQNADVEEGVDSVIVRCCSKKGIC